MTPEQAAELVRRLARVWSPPAWPEGKMAEWVKLLLPYPYPQTDAVVDDVIERGDRTMLLPSAILTPVKVLTSPIARRVIDYFRQEWEKATGSSYGGDTTREAAELERKAALAGLAESLARVDDFLGRQSCEPWSLTDLVKRWDAFAPMPAERAFRGQPNPDPEQNRTRRIGGKHRGALMVLDGDEVE